ncbi:MAG: glyoxalase/bleomycin resistance protein/dioxygenase [Hyphomicrobiales bacterium]|jgi:predicted enzyme related to lactoylglutathione lyase|nr:glyoxalase/bleomycin resistance protein/dioxygenase [Hyphomicrobiales bacterium]
MTASDTAGIGYINIFAQDVDVLVKFYEALLGFPRTDGGRSAIYRSVDAGSVELGFNADAVYEMLGVGDRRPPIPKPVNAYFTARIASPEAIEEITKRCIALGGSAIKGPYATHYGATQSMLADPEGNCFRIEFRPKKS